MILEIIIGGIILYFLSKAKPSSKDSSKDLSSKPIEPEKTVESTSPISPELLPLLQTSRFLGPDLALSPVANINYQENLLQNPAFMMILKQTTSLTIQGIQQVGIFAASQAAQTAAEEGANVGALINAMTASQSDWTNPYSGWVESIINFTSIFTGIPLLGTVLGGFLEGILGTEPPEEIDPDVLTKIGWQDLNMIPPEVRRFGREWKDHYKSSSSEYIYFENQMSQGKILAAAYKKTLFYQAVFAPAMARFYSAHSMILAETYQGNPFYDIPPYLIDPASPLAKWNAILEKRDNQLMMEPGHYGDPKAYAILYSGGQAVVFISGGNNPKPIQFLFIAHGGNPFYRLTDDQIRFFYSSVLPTLEQWALWDSLPPSYKPPEEVYTK